MKAKFLKLAGVKNEKEFYKKFPTEEAFMAKYGKQLKKLAGGGDVINDYDPSRDLPIEPIEDNEAPNVPLFAGQLKERIAKENPQVSLKKKSPWDNVIEAGIASLPSAIGSIQSLNQEGKQIKKLQQYGKIADIVKEADATRNKFAKSKYVRPEDQLTQNENPLGVGTTYLAENGAEIMNTYAPDVIYTDLGYEPLNESNDVKQFADGGNASKSPWDAISGVIGGLGSIAGSYLGGGTGEVGPAGQLLNTAANVASFIPGVGPIGSAAIKFGAGLLGGGIDSTRQKQEKELKNATSIALGQSSLSNFQNANSSFMEEGGWVSHDWQPQVIASFGEHKVKDLLKSDPMMDTLRAGGHLKEYTPPSERAMYTGRDLPYQMEDGGQMAMGGDLQVHRGYAEPISTNPYLPNGGETVMFRGPSHENGGMPISYGNNGVEVEGGEPAMVMKDGGQKDNLIVFGGMQYPGKDMTFKKYAAELSKQEAKQNKIVSKSTDLINSSNTDDPFDLLSFNSGKAMALGANMKLKSLAEDKMDAAAVQNAILDTAEEYGLDPAKLAESKNVAKFGGKFTAAPIAKNGTKETDYTSIDKLLGMPSLKKQDITVPFAYPGMKKPAMLKSTLSSPTPQYKSSEDTTDENEKGGDKLYNYLTAAASMVSPFLRYIPDNPLDSSQLAPELLAKSLNQVQPVQAQSYIPLLAPNAPTYSFQDQLNEITGQSRNAMKLAQGDPSALAAISAGAYQARSKVLADAFRTNQAEKQRVAEQNRAVLNEARLKNLAIYDQQYERQSKAASQTKAEDIEIAKSFAAKDLQNRLENRQMRIAQQMNPAFSYTPEGTFYKNPFYQAPINPYGTLENKAKYTPPAGASIKDYEFDKETGQWFPKTAGVSGSGTTSKVKNGGIVKAFKNF